MIKSYDYILGNGKFTNWFDIITGVIICSAMSFSLTEVLFSFNFKFNFQKVLIFTILFLLFLLLFYYFIKQRRYKLLDEKIVFGFRKKEILYRNINSLFFTLTYRPKGIYNIGLGEPYLYVKEHGTKKYICNITICLVNPNIMQKSYEGNITAEKIGVSSAYSFNCYDIKSIFNLLHHSEASVYVARSFLILNKWTINRFCKEYDISIEKVQLINDGN
jgi:hypothetical protein